jgi:hypothetical protein
MVARAKQTGGAGPATPTSGGDTGPLGSVNAATYVPNFSRSPSNWLPNGDQLIDSELFVQLLSYRPGRTSFIIVNTGLQPLLISNQGAGVGALTVKAGASYDLDTEGELWAAITPAGATTVDVTETYGNIPQDEQTQPPPAVPAGAWGLR